MCQLCVPVVRLDAFTCQLSAPVLRMASFSSRVKALLHASMVLNARPRVCAQPSSTHTHTVLGHAPPIVFWSQPITAYHRRGGMPRQSF
eukprot:jgi/Mesvir1/12626/Mv26529-RA.1